MARGAPGNPCWVLFASLLYASTAFAHAGPQVRMIHFGATDADPAVLVANRGLFLGTPAEGAWRLMCNEALEVTTTERPDVVMLPGGRMLVPTTMGLLATDDHGCNWPAIAAFSTWSTTALAQHPTEPMRLYAATYAPGETALRESMDGGLTWQVLLKGADSEFYRYLQIARSDPKTIYVAKLNFGSMKFEYFVSRSNDAGKTWQDQPVPVNEDESDLELLAVSPTDPKLLIAKGQAESPALMPERLLVSHDGGATFESPLSIHVISEAAFSADGKTAWLATDDGLFRSTDGAHSFARVGPADLVSCVVERDKQLYVCGWVLGVDAGNPGIGVSKDGGETFTNWMHLTDITQPVTCAPTASTSQVCAMPWVDWQRELLGPTGIVVPGWAGGGAGVGGMSMGSMGDTAGSSGAAADGGGGVAGSAGEVSQAGRAGSSPVATTPAGSSAPATPAPEPSSSGCAVAVSGAGRTSAGLLLAWLSCLLVLAVRRRSRRGMSTEPTTCATTDVLETSAGIEARHAQPIE